MIENDVQFLTPTAPDHIIHFTVWQYAFSVTLDAFMDINVGIHCLNLCYCVAVNSDTLRLLSALLAVLHVVNVLCFVFMNFLLVMEMCLIYHVPP